MVTRKGKTMILKTATEKEIECDSVVVGQQFSNCMHIHTHSITPIEAYQIFGDPNESSLLTVIKDDETKVYKYYTEVYSVQKSPFYKDENEILIWLNQKFPEE